jgi:hypothetical protein
MPKEFKSSDSVRAVHTSMAPGKSLCDVDREASVEVSEGKCKSCKYLRATSLWWQLQETLYYFIRKLASKWQASAAWLHLPVAALYQSKA